MSVDRTHEYWALRREDDAPVAVSIPPAESADPLSAFASEAAPSEDLDDDAGLSPDRESRLARLWSTRDRRIAVVAVLIAVVEAVFLLRGVALTPAATSAEGWLRVASSAEGAHVVVDRFISGLAPFELPLRPGTHHVQVRSGGLVREFTANIRPGAESHLVVEFAGAAASAGTSETAATAGPAAGIEISSDPPGAHVLVDGTPRGVTPLGLSDLSPGNHDVVLTSASGNVKRRVTLAPATRASLVVSMPAVNAASSGWITLQSRVVAQIYDGRELLGTTEVRRLMLPAGRRTLRLVNTALNLEQEQPVEVIAGQTRTINVTLPNGLLSVNAIPWAQVWIDGEAKGETPIGNLAIPIGTHEVVLRHPQLGEQRRATTVTLGGVTRMGVDLRK